MRRERLLSFVNNRIAPQVCLSSRAKPRDLRFADGEDNSNGVASTMLHNLAASNAILNLANITIAWSD
jgi:hypothetical protein